MVFTDLSPTIQNLVMLNFEFFAKFVLIVGTLVACLYLTSTFKKTDRSPFVAMRYIKGVFYIISKFYIFISPMMIFLFYPQVSVNTILILLVSFYSVMFSIIGFIVIPINLLLFGSSFITDMLGLQVKRTDMGNKIRKEYYDTIGVGKK